MRAMRLTLAVLVATSVSMTVVWGVCAAMRPQVAMFTVVATPTGNAIRPVPPPSTVAEDWSLLGAGVSWLMTVGAAAGTGVWRVVQLRRTPVEKNTCETRPEPGRLPSNQ